MVIMERWINIPLLWILLIVIDEKLLSNWIRVYMVELSMMLCNKSIFVQIILGGYANVHEDRFYGPIKCNSFILWLILKLCDMTMQTSWLLDMIDKIYDVLCHNDNKTLLVITLCLIKSKDTICDTYSLLIFT